MNTIDTNESPCLTCARVKDPAICENKNCKTWREWFLRRWKEITQKIKNDRCGAKMDLEVK